MNDRAERIAALSPEKRALLMRQLGRSAAAAAQDDIRRQPRAVGTSRFPATPGQQRLWYLHELDRSSTAYVLPIVIRFRGRLDVGALRRSVGWLVERHEALRTGFGTGPDGVVEQIVHEAVETPIPVIDVPAAEVSARVRGLLAQGFDLRMPPLLRAAVLRTPDEWVLVLCVHHIVVDGWSLGVLVTELEAAYPLFAEGKRPDLPAPALQYADFAVWQQKDSAELDRRLSYWRDRLAEAPALDLPADRQPAEARTTEGDAVALLLPPELVAELTDLAATQEATLFMVLAAGLTVVLGRWSGQDDVIIGTPVAGRHRVELEEMVGFFVNTLPLRFQPDGDGSFRELLRHVREVCTEAYAHQEVPFDRIVGEAGRRSSGYDPLVRVLLALRNVQLPPLRLPGVTSEVVEMPSGGAQLDLALELAPSADGGLSGMLEFATDLFDRATALRIADAVRSVLQAAATDPGLPVHTLPVLDDRALHQVVNDFSGAHRTGTASAPVSRWFETTVDAAGERVAVVEDATGRSLSYRELDRRANRLARHLHGRGIGVEDAVGVYLDRGTELIVSLLAVFKAGAVHVPLDPGHPPGRLAQFAADAAPKLILTTSALAAAAPPGPAVVRVDTIEEGPAELSADRLDTAPAWDDAAYVLFTSGSTGRPKGVVCSHRAIANRLAEMVELLSAEPGERVLQKTPISFDPSLTEMLAPLLSGATLIVAEPGRHSDAFYLLDVIERHRITSIDFVPSMLPMVLERAGARDKAATLRRVYCGGEELSTGLARTFLRTLPGTGLINLYGPTEAAVDVSSHRVTEPVPDRVPIGRPLPGVELYVLDQRLLPQPIGVPGQLFIGGAQLARGYLGAPGITAERFIPHPFVPGSRLYATGDRAVWQADGALRFLGRSDAQLKIRGNRVEPGEIEAVLRAHPGVADAAVAVRGAGGSARLIGYLIPAGGDQELTSLRAAVRDRLPAAMVPSAFLWLDAFPLTSAGKLDREALPDPGTGSGAGVREEPADPLETVVAGIWAEVLSVPEVGALDDFFELGGHSLLATKLVALAGDLFRLELPLRAFIEAGTVRDFAARLRAAGAAGAVDVDRVAELVLKVRAMSAEEVSASLRPAATPGE